MIIENHDKKKVAIIIIYGIFKYIYRFILILKKEKVDDIIKKLKIKQLIIKVSEEEHDIIKRVALDHKMFMKDLIITAVAEFINKIRKGPK